jgi:hypothetical protein
LALVALSVVEQRYRAVTAVLDGARVTKVAVEIGVRSGEWARGWGAIAAAAWPGLSIGHGAAGWGGGAGESVDSRLAAAAGVEVLLDRRGGGAVW